MAKHRVIPTHSAQSRTFVGAALTAGALILAPAGMALVGPTAIAHADASTQLAKKRNPDRNPIENLFRRDIRTVERILCPRRAPAPQPQR